jgi:hypothetical protein
MPLSSSLARNRMSQPTLKRSLTESTARLGKSVVSFCFELEVVMNFVDCFVSYTYLPLFITLD